MHRVRQKMQISAIEKLRDFLTQFNTDFTLRTISLASGYLLKQNKAYVREEGVLFTAWQLAFLAQEALVFASDTSLKKFEPADLVKAIELYEKLPDPIEIADPDTNPDEHFRAIIRLANLQYPSQEKWFFELARTAILLIDLPKVVTKMPKLVISDLSEAITGLKIDEIIRIGLLITAATQIKPAPIVDLETLSKSTIPRLEKELKINTLRNFAKAFGTKKEILRVRYNSRQILCGYEKFAFNQLRVNPLIHYCHDKYYLPCHMYLIERITRGMYFALADSVNLGAGRNDFRTKFGYLFEAYVGEQLKQNLDDCMILPELIYADGRRSPDWILVKGNQAVLIECKSSQLSISAKTYAEGEFLRKDAEKIFIKSKRQIYDFIDYIEIHPDDIPELKGVTHMFGLIICYVPLYHANSIYRTMFGKEIGPKPNKLVDCQFAGIGEFEDILGIAAKINMIDLLKRKAKSKDYRGAEMGQFIENIAGKPELNRWLCSKTKDLLGWYPSRDRD